MIMIMSFDKKNIYTFLIQIGFSSNHNQLFRYNRGYFHYNPVETVISVSFFYI